MNGISYQFSNCKAISIFRAFNCKAFQDKTVVWKDKKQSFQIQGSSLTYNLNLIKQNLPKRMTSQNETLRLDFFRTVPDNLMALEPLASSMQSLESCFVLIADDRFPQALVAIVSSIESALKAKLKIQLKGPGQFYKFYELIEKAFDFKYSEWTSGANPLYSFFSKEDLTELAEVRNRIVHYGFSSKDDEISAKLLLKVCIKLISKCYEDFFKFALLNGLIVEFGEQLNIALKVYEKSKNISEAKITYCFNAFAHLIRWNRSSNKSSWELEALEIAENQAIKYNLLYKEINKLERLFGTVWKFDCPICGELETFVCELNLKALEKKEIKLEQGMCPNCYFFLRKNSPFLAEQLCQKQIIKKQLFIFKEFGIV